MNTNNKLLISAAFGLCLTLAGCGGEGGSSSSVSNSSTAGGGTASSQPSTSVPLNLDPPPPEEVLVVAIDSGSETNTEVGDILYLADDYFQDGDISTTGDTIAGTVDDALYQTERYGSYAYEVPVTNARYSVLIHLAEIYHTAAGERSFTISVEGNTELSQLDLYSLVGHDGAFEYVVYDVEVTDGSLTIELETEVDNATISAFAIYSDDGGRLN